MATGIAPFRGESSGLIFKAILDGTPTSALRLNPALPGPTGADYNKSLEKNRDLRYQHACEIRTDLLPQGEQKRGRFDNPERSYRKGPPGCGTKTLCRRQIDRGRGHGQGTSFSRPETILDDESITSMTSEDVRTDHSCWSFLPMPKGLCRPQKSLCDFMHLSLNRRCRRRSCVYHCVVTRCRARFLSDRRLLATWWLTLSF